MIATHSHIDIFAPPESVFALIANPRRLNHCSPTFVSFHGYEGDRMQVGDSWQVVDRFMGREVTSDYTCQLIEPFARIVVGYNSAYGEGTITWTLTPITGGTRLEHQTQADTRGFLASLAFSIVKRDFEATMRHMLRNIKMDIED